MALTQPVGLYGLWNITGLDYVSKMPLFYSKVAGEFTIPFSFDLEDFIGGANKFVLDAEPKYAKADTTFSFKQFDNQLFTYLSGANTTVNLASATGSVTTLTAGKGTSMTGAGGIQTVSLTALKSADLKAGRYIVIADSASTVDVYGTTDMDFSGVFTSGAALQFVDNTLKITATPLTLSDSAVAIPSIGVSLTGVSSPSLTIGDTGYFDVFPANIGSETIIVGQANMFVKRISLIAASQPKSNGETFYVYCPKVQPAGFDVSLKEYSWAANSPKMKILQSTAENMVCTINRTFRETE